MRSSKNRRKPVDTIDTTAFLASQRKEGISRGDRNSRRPARKGKGSTHGTHSPIPGHISDPHDLPVSFSIPLQYPQALKVWWQQGGGAATEKEGARVKKKRRRQRRGGEDEIKGLARGKERQRSAVVQRRKKNATEKVMRKAK